MAVGKAAQFFFSERVAPVAVYAERRPWVEMLSQQLLTTLKDVFSVIAFSRLRLL
jgi:hypothetical protein